MKKMIIAASALILLTACNNNSADEKNATKLEAAPITTQQANPADADVPIATNKAPPAQSTPLTKHPETNVSNEATKWVDQTKKLGKAAWDASKEAAARHYVTAGLSEKLLS